ncbi:MAG: Prolipoprotein diacylglyceryl transferase [Bacteroidetes bacterium ADurb.Bin397]|jgi:phosphatidylglycerol:prolipoprotein diacylglycerol transferase|nr:MAG: Prolipoprotein diacylglyceryl transferase [Bacteroidetes bacterium ADurb.Bin397]
MYPTISDLIFDLTGLNIPLPIQSFGFLLAISFICAAYTLSLELKRKEKLGIFKPLQTKVLVGEKVTTVELITSGIIGFLLGYKLLYAALNYSDFVSDTQGILLSAQGSVWGGIIGAAFGAWLKYSDNKKQQLDKPEWKEITIRPYEMVGNITMVAAFSGLIGAKIFHNLENLDDFAADPWGSLISFSGLTMYGGLIVGGAGVIWYSMKQGMNPFHFADSAAPGLMLAYGTGRLGCQISGDGDWGIVNNNPKPSWMEFLPDWFWSYNYPHNVLSEGIPIPGCTGPHCMMLPEPVYPTPLYEAIVCIGLFFVLWSLRTRINIAGMLFSIYLIFNGVERFFIEKIRVNTKYHISGHEITQAEIISVILIILGTAGCYFFYKKSQATNKP